MQISQSNLQRVKWLKIARNKTLPLDFTFAGLHSLSWLAKHSKIIPSLYNPLEMFFSKINTTSFTTNFYKLDKK